MSIFDENEVVGGNKVPVTSPSSFFNQDEEIGRQQAEQAKKAEEEARKAKAYASKKFESRNERALPGYKKVSTRKTKEMAQQERRRTNQAAQTAKTAAKQAGKQTASPDFNAARKSSPRFFDQSTIHQQSTPLKIKRFSRKV